MRMFITVSLGAGLLIAADAPKGDLGQLQGTWRVVRAEHAAEDFPTFDGRLIIQGNRFTEFETIIAEGVIKLDRADKPRRYEKTVLRYGGRESKNRTRSVGLCALEGDIYKECSAFPGGDPPTEISSKFGSKHILEVWKRTDGIKASSIEGTWILVERVMRGMRRSEEAIKGYTLTIKERGREGEFEFRLKHEAVKHGVITLDPTTNPRKIDYIYNIENLTNVVILGIYRIDGDRLMECSFGPTPRERSTDFSTKPGDMRRLRVFEREKETPR